MEFKTVMKDYFLVLLSFVLFAACQSEKKNQSDEPYVLIDSLSTVNLIPDSYVFSSIPQQKDDYLYYLDKSIGGIIRVDKHFKDPEIILSEGQDFKSIPKIFYFSIAHQYLFAFGNNQCLVYDLDQNTYVDKYAFPFRLSQQIIYDEGRNQYLTVSTSEKDIPNIVSFNFSKSNGFFDIQERAKIEGDNQLHYLEYSGWLTILGNSIFYIKDWVGEVDEFSRESFQHIRQFQLPHSGNLEDNKNYSEGKYTSNYFQAYSVVNYDDHLYILREIDWESELVGEKSMDNPNFIQKIRNRVHVFNNDFDLTESFRLSKPATFINFIDDNLYTLNYEDEKLYIYHDSN